NPFSKDEEETLNGLPGMGVAAPSGRALEIAKEHVRRTRVSERNLAKLRGGLKKSVIAIPRIFKKDLEQGDLKYIASRIESQLGGRN
ncbi:MAG TPA: hypothetical protein VHC46_08925, partial [Thermodesulfobacteriota bacterium]|nr:hypothetical protein [Thermodesulfobacteriota bacterium]